MRKVPRETPKPTHGDGTTETSTLEPQKCRACGAVLVADIVENEVVVSCPNGCEECV